MAIFTAIAAAITAISSWTVGLGALGTFAIGNFLLRAAVQLGVSALAKAFAGGGSDAVPFSIQGNIRSGGAVPRSFVMGPSLTAGSLVWHSEWGTAGGTPNAYYTQVIALSDLPVAGFTRWFIDGRAVTLAATESANGFAANEYTENGVEHAWIKFHDGNQTVADPFLTGTVGPGAPRDYSADRIGTGVAYAIVTFRVNEEMFTGFPASKFVLDGVKLYDISRDDTQGGTGAQRWADPATWGGDGDALPAVQAYNLARGLSFGGQWFYGLQGLTAARLPAAHWVAQVGKCRVQVQGDNGLEPIYRCAGEITVDSEIGSAFEAIMTSCAGRMSEVGGVFKIYVGAPDAPVAHFEDKDIVSLAPQTFTPFFGLSNTVNGVIASYPSPDEGYVIRTTPPLYNPAYELEDGGRRLMTSVQLSFVPFPVQAQRLLQGELDAARRARRHTFTLPARYRLIEPGDTVTFTSVRNGYLVKQFRIDGVIDLPNCNLIVDMTEVDPADHGTFNFATDYVPVVPAPLLPVRPTAQGVIGFNPVPADIQDGAGTARRPGILMQWNATVEDISGILFEVRLAASLVVVSTDQTNDFGRGELPVEAGLVAATAYEARAKYIPASPRAVTWTAWVPVATNDVRLTVDDIAPGAIEWGTLASAVQGQIDSAGDANASAAAALTAQGLAEAAQTGAQTAQGSAELAQATAAAAQTGAQSAQTAAELAQGITEAARDAASGSAAAASSSEGLAASARDAAIDAVVAGFPSDVGSPREAWAQSLHLAGAFPRAPVPVNQIVSGDADFGECFEFSAGANAIFGPSGAMIFDRSRSYLVTVRIKTVDDGTLSGCRVLVGFSTFSGGGTVVEVANRQIEVNALQAVAAGVVEYSVLFHPDTLTDLGTFSGFTHSFTHLAASDLSDLIDFQVRQNGAALTDANTRVGFFEVKDVTDVLAANISANASFTSEQAALASETAAGSSASAAQSAEIAAQTAEGNAAGSATASAGSASAALASETAAGSSASAAQSAEIAAQTAEGNAAGSATAAAGSASSAQASQTAAGSSASAAQSAQLAAQTAEGNASGSATASAGSASAALASENAAGSSSTAAQTAQTASATDAANASVSAAQAASSATSASGDAVSASASVMDARALELRSEHVFMGAALCAPQVCMLAGTYQVAADEPNTAIYLNGAPALTLGRELKSLALVAGDRLTSDKPFAASRTADPFVPLAVEALAGTMFGAKVTRNPPAFVVIYPLAAGKYRAAAELSDTGGDLSAYAWVDIAARTPVTVTLGSAADPLARWLYVETTAPALVMRGAVGVNTDFDIMAPAHAEIMTRAGGNVWMFGAGASVVADGSYRRSSDLVAPIYAAVAGDGAGSDAEGHLPFPAIGDEYILPVASVSDYFIAATETVTVTVTDSVGAVLGEHVLDASAGAASLQVGTLSGADPAISSNGPFYVTGTKPFFLRTNYGQDELAVFGYRRALRQLAGLGAGEAAAYQASQASLSATDAGSQAASATNSANTAATNAGNAGGSATAAAASASSALASENAAGSSASAAQSAQLAAETAQGAAAVSASQSASSATSSDAARSDAQAARDVAVAVEARQNYAEGLTDPGFEAGTDGLAGTPAGWIGASSKATAFSDGSLSYRAAPLANTAGAFASVLGFGAPVSGSGPWWWIGKRFRCAPGQTFTASVQVRMAAVSTWAALQAAGSGAVGEDDAWFHNIWYDADGVKIGEYASWSANYRLCNSTGADISAGVFYLFDPSLITAPAGAAFLEFRLVAGDGNGAVRDKLTYADLTGNASVVFDDFTMASSGAVSEVSPAEWSANLHRVAAGVSEVSSATAQLAAEGAAAGAVFARDVAAKIYGGDAYANPIFSDWAGAYPDGVTNASVSDGSAMSKNTANAHYENCLEMDTGSALTANRPYWQLRNTDALVELPVAEECAGVSISAEVELVSGLWGGALVRVQWSAQGTGGTSANVDVFLANALSETPGLRQMIEIDAIKPVDYVPGSLPGQIRIIVYGTSNTGGLARAQNVTRYHRFGARALSQSASAYIDQKAITDLEGNAAASLTFRAKAGGAVGAVEIVASDNVSGGAASKVTLTGTEIEFDGMSVFKDALASDNFLTGVAGWRLSRDGTLELINLITRDAIINGEILSEKLASNSVTKVRRATGTTGTPSITWTPTIDGEATAFLYADVSTSGSGAASYTRSLRIAGTVRGGVTCSRPDLLPDQSSGDKQGMVAWKAATTAGVQVTVDAPETGSGTTQALTMIVIETKR